jgi:4-amino-4-deoxy-L-arabinose transferase-like glycosyltransferase
MRERKAVLLLSGLVLLTGFALRVNYLLHISPIGDEYITMLAVDSTLQHGYPRLPSGLYYDHGLLFTYVDTLFARVFGLTPIVARLPSLIAGMLTIASVYAVGSQWFSPRAGVIASCMIALSPQAIMWAARARMYGLWSWLFLLATFYLATGVLLHDRSVLRCLGIAALIGAAFSHILTVGLMMLFIPGLMLAKVIAPRNWSLLGDSTKRLWPEAALLAIGALLLLIIRKWGGPWGIVGRVVGDPASPPAPLHVAVRALLTTISFASLTQGLLALPAVVGALFLLFRLIQRRSQEGDALLVYLIILLTGGIVGVGSFSRFYADRYVFALQPIFALLVGRELAFLGDLLSGHRRSLVGLLLPVILVTGLLTPIAWRTATRDEINLDRAFAFVKHHRQRRDRVGTTIPAAAYLLLDRCDYYCLEGGETFADAGRAVDIWTSTPHYGSAEAFRPVLAEERRTWLLIDSWSWKRYYPAPYRRLIEHRMELAFQLPGVRVYVHDE